MEKTETKKRTRNVVPYYVAVFMASVVVISMTVMTPLWGELPVEITEEVTVIAVTEAGAVVETSFQVPVLIDRTDLEPGQTIEVTYTVPQKFLDAIDDARLVQEKLDTFTP